MIKIQRGAEVIASCREQNSNALFSMSTASLEMTQIIVFFPVFKVQQKSRFSGTSGLPISIPRLQTSITSFIFSSMSIRQGTSSMSWILKFQQQILKGFIPLEVVSYSDSDWAGCQRSRRSTSGSLITLFSVNLSSTSRTQASISHSSAEAELYATTQAAVESLAIKHFIKELKSAILSKDVKITLKTDSSASKTMASCLGISRKSEHIELRRLWIQDILSEGVMSLEKVGTHHNPSDVLTKFVQASVLGQHLPKLNLFKDHSLSQVFKFCAGIEKIKPDSKKLIEQSKKLIAKIID